MEPKVIFYIVIAVLYLLYSAGKKKAEEQQPSAPSSKKPVKPANPLQEVMEEIKRMREDLEKQNEAKRKTIPPLKPIPTTKPVVERGKDIFIREKKVVEQVEGRPMEVSTFQQEWTSQEGKRTTNIANEEIYKIESLEEVEAKEDAEVHSDYRFIARDALIGSLIMERKY